MLYDLDSRIPNLALMKLSAYHKRQGDQTVLSKDLRWVPGDRYYASTVFHNGKSLAKVDLLQRRHGSSIEIGGSGLSLSLRLPPEVEECFPDYSLYGHSSYAIGFLTRGCPKRCRFCLVPTKEGRLRTAATFDEFVPPGQRHVMLLDDNLLASPNADELLEQIIRRRYAVNFSQTLDITYLDRHKYELLQRVDSRNARFTKRMVYFSCNGVAGAGQFIARKDMLLGFGKDSVSVVSMYGFDTRLSEDYQVLRMIQRLRLIPFLQEYQPIPGVPSRVPADFFDCDLDSVIRMTFRSNGQNWEKYLRWLNRLYFSRFGRYYLPLLRTIYRYNHREGIQRYLSHPELLTEDLYHRYGQPAGPAAQEFGPRAAAAGAASPRAAKN